jgi:tetratricopeptide (TPR) repeat protein
MSQDEPAAKVLSVNWSFFEVLYQAAIYVLIGFGVAALLWLDLGSIASVVVAAVLAAAFVYALETLGREKLILSDDQESVEIAAGEKKLLRALERFPYDTWQVRLRLAIVCAAVGCAVGIALSWAGAHTVFCILGAGGVSFFALFVVYMLRDQVLAGEYVLRGQRSYLAGDFSAAIGDASESMILSLKYRYEAHMIRGLVYLQLAAYDRAANEFNAALAERPRSDEAYIGFRTALNPEGWSKEDDQAAYDEVAHIIS